MAGIPDKMYLFLLTCFPEGRYVWANPINPCRSAGKQVHTQGEGLKFIYRKKQKRSEKITKPEDLNDKLTEVKPMAKSGNSIIVYTNSPSHPFSISNELSFAEKG